MRKNIHKSRLNKKLFKGYHEHNDIMVLTEIQNRHILMNNILPNNPGVIIIKFTATWCGPCKKIQPLVNNFFNRAPENVICYDIDVDVNSDVFSFFKSKKMVAGIPAILVWERGNTSYVPNSGISGGDPHGVANFLSQYIQ